MRGRFDDLLVRTLVLKAAAGDLLPVSLRASFGVACGTESLEKLLKDADTALYLSKERGRDQVSVSSADHETG